MTSAVSKGEDDPRHRGWDDTLQPWPLPRRSKEQLFFYPPKEDSIWSDIAARVLPVASHTWLSSKHQNTTLPLSWTDLLNYYYYYPFINWNNAYLLSPNKGCFDVLIFAESFPMSFLYEVVEVLFILGQPLDLQDIKNID